MRFVLWDIDGTLVHSAGYGRDAFADAFRSVFGRDPDRGLVPMAGRTDHDIALAVLELNGIGGGEEHLEEFSGALADALLAKEAEMRAAGHAFPGAREAIEAFDAHDGIVQSLLTGNIEQNAVLKLAAFDLADLLDFEIGAYGSDHRVRSELVAIAHRKAERKLGRTFAASDTVLIGDTPRDVAAAHDNGARAIAVATGPYDTEQLSSSGADHVFEDLTDTDALVAAVLSP